MNAEEPMSTQERQLCQFLADLPRRHDWRYNQDAARELLTSLFWSLAGGKDEYMKLLFPQGKMADTLKLGDAQGAVEGAEYTEAARGKRCGHIFKPGEASYMCRTCGTDETCCLCSRCFDSTDHTGHMVRIQLSVGNSGCCDCGDDEAWKTPLFCTIHSDVQHAKGKGKEKEADSLPQDFVASLQMTIGRVFDYICDVISCSPEQLKETKSEESILKDEQQSRLTSSYHGSESEACPTYAIVLWNDEKHTVKEVTDQVARSVRKTRTAAAKDAWDTDAIGRSILAYRDSVRELLIMSERLEQIRITVTIRSARDTFREQMCGTLVEWLSDISGCSAGSDSQVLRRTVCEELMRPWRRGSLATHTAGLIDDEERAENEENTTARYHGINARFIRALQAAAAGGNQVTIETLDADEDDDDDDEVDEENNDDLVEEDDAIMDDSSVDLDLIGTAGEEDEEEEDDEDDVMMVDIRREGTDMSMSWAQSEALEDDEATMAGYPPPPLPPPAGSTRDSAAAPSTSADAEAAATSREAPATRDREVSPTDSDPGEPLIAPAIYAKANADIPKTPGHIQNQNPRPGKYWIEAPSVYTQRENVPPAEDVFKRVRLDWLLLFDLRMWKKVRNDLRSLYISTVVQVPEFKRVLALRFASLYTILAQLYLIGDREPDHSIINLSLQMLTTPSITAEVVERGNFMTSLLAILYTFLTTRQVGHPWEVSADAVMSFSSGSVTNRRMYHFYQDLKYLFGAPHVQERLRYEPRYLMQFLDLVKLHQCVGPNVRAVEQHVEYEADSWITASLVTRQINLQARNLAEAFKNCSEADLPYLEQAIRMTSKAVILISIGAERARFQQAEKDKLHHSEVKHEVRFKTLDDFEFDTEHASFEVVKFVVEKESISFHHALHYTLSWLVECAKSLPASTIRSLMSFTAQELKSQPRLMGRLQMPKRNISAEGYLMAAFDYPLRVCAWLAQIKANMWVRNGMSLRHQAQTYRGVGQRDVSHHRDIFLLQTAMVTCNPSRVLVSIVDRFGMDSWIKGFFELKSEAQDDGQHLDVVEDMIHLLIVILSDRTSLVASADEDNSRILAMRRDITHVLCFKPLSFNDICNKLPEKYQEQEDFHQVLDEMATFKPPEGISDVGTFELRPEFIEEIDPYIAHYNKNQREESEQAYRKKMATKTGKTPEEIVYEPKLHQITSGLFVHLGAFVNTGMFAQIVYYALLYPLVAPKITPPVPATRLETFLQVILHLVLLAIQEDKSGEDDMAEDSTDSFVSIALTRTGRSNFMPDSPKSKTIVSLLNMLSTKEEFKSAHPKVALVLKRLKQKRPKAFEFAFFNLGVAVDRVNTASPASHSAEEERERRKKAALSRQAKVMAQFQQQQKSFMENQAKIDWGSDMEEEEEEEDTFRAGEGDGTHNWSYPSGTCILCQEDTDNGRLYGTFALISKSAVLRMTDFQDPDLVREASQTPCNLDRSAEEIRPFGIARENRKMVEKLNAQGEVFLAERQTIGKGFPGKLCQDASVANGCGHLMHYHCFEAYVEATQRRHTHQIARHHPENTKRLEFVCPLCKALGNAFLPIVWKGLEESYPGQLQALASFGDFVEQSVTNAPWAPDAKRDENGEPQMPDLETPSTSGSLVEGMVRSFAFSDQQSVTDDSDMSPAPIATPPSVAEHSVVSTPEAYSAPAAGGSTQLEHRDGPVLRELLSAYRRLRDTLKFNLRANPHHVDPKGPRVGELSQSMSLVQTVAHTISAVEVQQRGIEAQPGLTFIEKIPEQSLSNLRILAETAAAYKTVGSRNTSEARSNRAIDKEHHQEVERQHCLLFISQYFGVSAPFARRPLDNYTALLDSDVFAFMVSCSYELVPAQKIDMANLLRICYLAELVKVVHHMTRNMPIATFMDSLANRTSQDPAMNNFADFLLTITKYGIEAQTASYADPSELGSNEGFQQPGVDMLEGWYTFVKKYALVFLRKSLLFLNTKFGVDFNNYVSPSPELDELDRLTGALIVPTFDEMCAALTDNANACGWPVMIQDIVSGWIKHQVLSPPAEGEHVFSAMAGHPGIFELVGLPKNYDTLIEEATRRRCPTTGKDLTDPVICLFCGDMFCSQANCCSILDPTIEDPVKIGGAQQHMRRCQGDIGVFLNVRKCAIFYLFRMSGSFTPAPYIDKYGETDPQLRHGRQLFLSQKRYDSMIRTTVLNHGVPSLISRKLEAEINNGGWDTL